MMDSTVYFFFEFVIRMHSCYNLCLIFVWSSVCCICWDSFKVDFLFVCFCSFGIRGHVQLGFICVKPGLRVYPLELFCICFPRGITSLGTQLLLISQFGASWDHGLRSNLKSKCEQAYCYTFTETFYPPEQGPDWGKLYYLPIPVDGFLKFTL